MFLGPLKNFKIMGYFQRDIISPRDIIGHKRTLSDRLGAKVTPLTARGCLYIVCDNFVLKTWKRATRSRKPLTTTFTDVNRLLPADQEAFVFVQREWPREESTRVKQLMPQQGLDPPTKSREVHLESLHLAIDSRFPLCFLSCNSLCEWNGLLREYYYSEWWDRYAAETLCRRDENSAQRLVRYGKGLKEPPTLIKW